MSGVRKKQSSAQKEARMKNLPHWILCERCDLSVQCPRKDNPDIDYSQVKVETVDTCFQTEHEGLSEDRISVVDKLSNDNFLVGLTLENKCKIITEILASEITSINQDAAIAKTKVNSTIEDIAKVDPNDWYNGRHPLLKSICDGLSQINDDDENSTDGQVRRINLVESSLKLVNRKFVSPLDMSGSILSQSINHSRIGGLVLSKTGTGGSHKILDRLFNEENSVELPDVPGAILEGIDNNQVPQRTYRAQLNSQKKMSVVTARMRVKIDENGTLENMESLMPGKHTFTIQQDGNPSPNINSSNIMPQVFSSDKCKTILFESEKQLMLNKYLQEVKESMVEDKNTGEWSDTITLISEASKTKPPEPQFETLEEEDGSIIRECISKTPP